MNGCTMKVLYLTAFIGFFRLATPNSIFSVVCDLVCVLPGVHFVVKHLKTISCRHL